MTGQCSNMALLALGVSSLAHTDTTLAPVWAGFGSTISFSMPSAAAPQPHARVQGVISAAHNTACL